MHACREYRLSIALDSSEGLYLSIYLFIFSVSIYLLLCQFFFKGGEEKRPFRDSSYVISAGGRSGSIGIVLIIGTVLLVTLQLLGLLPPSPLPAIDWDRPGKKSMSYSRLFSSPVCVLVVLPTYLSTYLPT